MTRHNTTNPHSLLSPLRMKAGWSLLCLLMLAACTQRSGQTTEERQDREAKRLLQGVWHNADGDTDAFLVRGDSLYFADDTSQPMRVWIYQDSLYIQGDKLRHYLITKQAEHLLKYVNVNGEEVKLTKDGDQTATQPFLQTRAYAMNLTRVTDVDTTATLDGATALRCTIHTEPTSDRVNKSIYNDLGLEVDNVYLDNASTVTVSAGGTQCYSHSFRKSEFSSFVPHDFLATAILRSVDFNRRDAHAVYLDASIGIPDAETCYVVELRIDQNGHFTKRLK